MHESLDEFTFYQPLLFFLFLSSQFFGVIHPKTELWGSFQDKMFEIGVESSEW